MIGSSAAIFGLVGVSCSLFKEKRWHRVASMLFFWAVLFLEAYKVLVGMFMGTANVAHIGGLIAGYVMCHLQAPSPTQKQLPARRKLSLLK